jgi:hypothetical protein
VRIGLSTWVGGSGPRDPWRPAVADSLDEWGCIDLRDYGKDRCLVVAPNVTSLPGLDFDLGDNALATFTPAVRNALGNRLGVTIDADDTIGDVLAVVLTALRPDRGRWKIICAGHALFDRPVVSGGATDDFNRANGGLGANWDLAGGTATQIASNAVTQPTSTANEMALWTAAVGADIYSQHVHSFTGAQSECYAVVRGDWDSFNAYCYQGGRKWNESYAELRLVNGSLSTPTQLAQAAQTWNTSTNYTTKITASGSTITVYVDGNQKVQQTNTTLGATYTQAGFSMDLFATDSVTMDNWEAGPLTAPPLFIGQNVTTTR